MTAAIVWIVAGLASASGAGVLYRRDRRHIDRVLAELQREQLNQTVRWAYMLGYQDRGTGGDAKVGVDFAVFRFRSEFGDERREVMS